MQNCKFCDSPVNNFEAECSTCGFASKGESPFNLNILRAYYNKFRSKNYPERNNFLRKVYEYLERYGWTQKDTAELFAVSPAQISTILKLGKDIKSGHPVEDQKEKQLQNHIYNQ